jgi:hypothetical protein
MQKDDRIVIRCESSLKEGLQEMAEHEERDFADFLRRLLHKLVDQFKENKDKQGDLRFHQVLKNIYKSLAASEKVEDRSSCPSSRFENS